MSADEEDSASPGQRYRQVRPGGIRPGAGGFGVELISTGGTAKALREAGLAVKDISDLTGFPEMLDGRVKTLHPRVHGGLLYVRGNAEHEAAVAAHGIQPIDMVIVNLYAFRENREQAGVAFGHLIENIDIGGPSMVRSAAKNFEDVAIVTSVADYPALIEELKANKGGLSRETRWRLAKQAFATTAAYDTAIANTLEQIAEAPAPDQPARPRHQARFPSTLRINMPLAQSLRYGENPHQRAALYSDGSGLRHCRRNAAAGQGTQLQQPGRPGRLLGTGPGTARGEGDLPAVAIIKHTNPCGAATGATVLEAYKKALECDPVSAFGGVIGINQAGRRRSCRGDRQAVRGGDRGSLVHARSAPAVRREEEPAAGGDPPCAAAPGRQARLRRAAAAGRRYRPRRRSRNWTS